MKRRPYYKDRYAKIGRISWRTIRKLGDSKEVDGNSKKIWRNNLIRKEEILKDWRLEIICDWRQKTFIWTDPQKS